MASAIVQKYLTSDDSVMDLLTRLNLSNLSSRFYQSGLTRIGLVAEMMTGAKLNGSLSPPILLGDAQRIMTEAINIYNGDALYRSEVETRTKMVHVKTNISVEQFLESIELKHFCDRFYSAGIDDVEDIASCTGSELNNMLTISLPNDAVRRIVHESVRIVNGGELMVLPKYTIEEQKNLVCKFLLYVEAGQWINRFYSEGVNTIHSLLCLTEKILLGREDWSFSLGIPSHYAKIIMNEIKNMNNDVFLLLLHIDCSSHWKAFENIGIYTLEGIISHESGIEGIPENDLNHIKISISERL